MTQGAERSFKDVPEIKEFLEFPNLEEVDIHIAIRIYGDTFDIGTDEISEALRDWAFSAGVVSQGCNVALGFGANFYEVALSNTILDSHDYARTLCETFLQGWLAAKGYKSMRIER